jgi:hypothetical protein
MAIEWGRSCFWILHLRFGCMNIPIWLLWVMYPFFTPHIRPHLSCILSPSTKVISLSWTPVIGLLVGPISQSSTAVSFTYTALFPLFSPITPDRFDAVPPHLVADIQATGYWHWFFLIQSSPQVEEMILSDPHKYWAMLSSRGSHTGVKWSEADEKMYQEGYFTKEGIHAVCHLPCSPTSQR